MQENTEGRKTLDFQETAEGGAPDSGEAALVQVNAPASRTDTESDPPTLVRFSKPYIFEGVAYTEIDLAGIEGLTTRDMTAAEKHLAKNGQVSPIPEMTMEYACFIAMLSTDKPIEFFRGLPTKDAIKLKNRVTNFFYGED